MTRIPKAILFAALAYTALSGCGPHLKKLGVCSRAKYRYANPQGVSLPSLEVPNVDEVNGTAPPLPQPSPAPATPAPPPDPATVAPPQQAAPAPTPVPSPPPETPVASPPKHGAMLLPAPGSTLFGSC